MAQGKYRLAHMMTVRELATYLRVHPSTIYKLLRRRELPGFRIASEWRFNSKTIDQWLLERNPRPSGAELGESIGAKRR
jgi:excisionase family DNA binding protein